MAVREILFRGKTLDTGEWIYGSLIDLDRESGYVYIMPSHKGASTLSPFNLIRLHSVLVDPETVGQWTGLVDKNGVKIFDGDVVRYKQVSRFPSRIRDLDEYIKGDIGEYAFIHEWTGVVTYKNGEFTPRPYICACEDFYYSFGYCDFEVIDNFWDNPELGGK